MARYQLRRPSPVKVYPRRVRRQDPAVAPEEEEEEEEEGPESPDSLFSSPSTVGAMSEGEDSESEDEGEEPASPSMPLVSGQASQAPSFTFSHVSHISTVAAVPQITGTVSSPSPLKPTITATADLNFSSRLARPSNPGATSVLSPPTAAESETAGERDPPQRSSPQEEKTMITKGAAAAAITLSILGFIAIIVAALMLFKRRKRRQQPNQQFADDTFDPSNTGSLHTPEIAHVGTTLVFAGGGGHLTRSTDRSDTLFGPGPYFRPETVTTDRNKSRFPINVPPPQPTPNPFADPPLNKAYDVLAGRPRSTTLTDRGSWVQNPFKNPGSERFDPFGELQQKARDERKKYLETSRKEAEAARLAEVARQFGAKDNMGLTVPADVQRKGSGVTIEGLGILDRSGGGGGYN
ncbi:hypothetical protein CC86DRAFT_110174 [Ophiobolus disseminans]|uniref:Uncharacterized protein n=1 Tax=Ophiobolus disseminans TaxID=1469910 RepID=A0A6A6ZLS3_9PLEO|nr:hypothetical protein CC86DRAFT_110174 [Ophiobolus disseminans]